MGNSRGLPTPTTKLNHNPKKQNLQHNYTNQNKKKNKGKIPRICNTKYESYDPMRRHEQFHLVLAPALLVSCKRNNAGRIS